MSKITKLFKNLSNFAIENLRAQNVATVPNLTFLKRLFYFGHCTQVSDIHQK